MIDPEKPEIAPPPSPDESLALIAQTLAEIEKHLKEIVGVLKRQQGAV